MSCNGQVRRRSTRTLYGAEAVDISGKRTDVVVIIVINAVIANNIIVVVVIVHIQVSSSGGGSRRGAEVLRGHVTLVRRLVGQDDVDDEAAVVVQSMFDVVDVGELGQTQLLLQLTLRHLHHHQHHTETTFHFISFINT